MGFLSGLRKFIGGDRFQNGLVMAQAALAGDYDAMARLREAQRLIGQRRAAEKEEALRGLKPAGFGATDHEPDTHPPVHLPAPYFHDDDDHDGRLFNPWAPFGRGGF